MKSIRDVYKIGRGPSSSHTMGPDKAARMFRAKNPNADTFRVILYGSLAETGRGHGTDVAIKEAFSPIPTEIVFNTEASELPHPNTMDFTAWREGKKLSDIRVMSIGGGDIAILGRTSAAEPDIYPHNSFAEISEYCKHDNLRLWQYAARFETADFFDYLALIWETMKRAISDGLSMTGTLPGGLGVERKAQYLYNQRHIDESKATRENRIVCAYAFAVSEQNADYATIVTAPTCGSCGVLPAVLKYMQDTRGFPDDEVYHALAAGGIIGNLVKTNATVSGAEAGCQAEIGTACAMAAAALGELFEMGIDQIEYAAEVALEHYLGLTCDPIGGLVQIPCIERNAVSAMRAINALSLANFLTNTRKISFDMVVETMYETGRDMSFRYRETSRGGLAKLYSRYPKK
ncbi:MAG: L-serine ammonia-lyase, iron-sulfur-dependent, subunit alpha [Oscillospiraceae bacterium]